MTMSELNDAISRITKKVTKKWTKQRKAEERGAKSRQSRMYVYSDRTAHTWVCGRILPGAYAHASGDEKYSVSKRQFYYACRDQFKNETAEELLYEYFANTLLVWYMNRNPKKTARWRITADPRGNLIIPNASYEIRVPVGTLAIDEHLAKERKIINPYADLKTGVDREWPAIGAGHRYQAVLFIEKEGFGPILEEARIAERFDIAIISCKGQSVVAARRFVDEVCWAGGGVPLFVVHDFDKAGFEISQRLTKVSEWAREKGLVKYDFKHDINVKDLGLRLEDVKHYELEQFAEECRFNGAFARDSICTEEEREFLLSGRRVELNALTSPQLIEWLERRLSEKLPNRLVPGVDVLARAYRRALAAVRINRAIEEVAGQAIERAESADIPADLEARLKETMSLDDETWDRALYQLAGSVIDENEDS
jgi:hypothetical protein